MDVGREWQGPEPIHRFGSGATHEADDALAIGEDFQRLHFDPFTQHDPLTRTQRRSRSADGDPGVVYRWVDEEYLDGCSRWSGTHETRVAHFGRVDDQQIARLQQRWELGEHGVAKGRRTGRTGSVHHQHATVSPHRTRNLGDEWFRERVVEIRRAVGAPTRRRSWSGIRGGDSQIVDRRGKWRSVPAGYAPGGPAG